MQVSDAIEPAKAIGKDSPNKRGVKSPQSPAKEKEGKVPKWKLNSIEVLIQKDYKYNELALKRHYKVDSEYRKK